jgi:recombination protein RecR
MGHVSPLEGVEPADLTIDALLRRVKAGGVHEVVLATNPNFEGDTTALHVASLLADSGVNVTRLARGIAPGSQIEFANRAMLEEALRGRREL